MPTTFAVNSPVLISVGTRPEIIKMAPVYAELRRRGVPVVWVHTRQHHEMADTLYEFFGIQPAYELALERRNVSLAREGIADAAVHMVGNTVVDAALTTSARLDELLAKGSPALPCEIAPLRRNVGVQRLITVMAYRRENWGDGIRSTARAVAALRHDHDEIAVVWPVHGNPEVSDAVHAELDGLVSQLEGRLTLCPPLDYPALHQ